MVAVEVEVVAEEEAVVEGTAVVIIKASRVGRRHMGLLNNSL